MAALDSSIRVFRSFAFNIGLAKNLFYKRVVISPMIQCFLQKSILFGFHRSGCIVSLKMSHISELEGSIFIL